MMAPRQVDFTIKIFFWFLSLISLIAVFVPFSPAMPASGIDPSWVYGMNQAVVQNLSFGKDIVFTFGPYSSIFTRTYFPETYILMMAGCFYLALSCWLCLIILMEGAQRRWVFAFCFILVGLMYSRDSLLFAMPFMIGLTVAKLFYWPNELWSKYKLIPFYLAILFTPLGLLPLVKGSMLILAGAIAGVSSFFFILNHKKNLALICLLSPLISMTVFWLISGQPIHALPSYFITMRPIVSGYTEAMSLDGNIDEIILYLMATFSLVITIFLQQKIDLSLRLFLILIYLLFLFLAFKSGFVRHDAHVLKSAMSLLISVILLQFIMRETKGLVTLPLIIIFWGMIDHHYVGSTVRSISSNLTGLYVSTWRSLLNTNKTKQLDDHFNDAVRTLQQQASIPMMPGTSDIYSYNQAYLIASKNTWSPRPILQSYSVYTPELAEINKQHLLGPKAPDNIIFRVEPIDHRFPTLEDGVSWPVILHNYYPMTIHKNSVYLRKKETLSPFKEPVIIKIDSYLFGEKVLLPTTDDPLFIQLSIEKTFLGHLLNLIFKPSQLSIKVELENGITKQYRLISGMAKSGFIVSPLVENTHKFARLFGKKSLLDDKKVKSIIIKSVNDEMPLWKKNYSIVFSRVNKPIATKFTDMYSFPEFIGISKRLGLGGIVLNAPSTH